MNGPRQQQVSGKSGLAEASSSQQLANLRLADHPFNLRSKILQLQLNECLVVVRLMFLKKKLCILWKGLSFLTKFKLGNFQPANSAIFQICK